MASVNKVFLIGNLTRDPELRYTPNGAAVSDLRLAVNRYYSTKENERREETLFIDVTVWNREAENCCNFLKKGQPVHVEGFLRMETWTDKATGSERSKIKVEADRVQFLGRRDDAGGGPGGMNDDEEFSPPPREARRPAPAADSRPANGAGRGGFAPPNNAPPRRPSAPPPSAPAEDEEDIPF